MQNHPSFCVLTSVYCNDNSYLFDRSLDSIYRNTIQPDFVYLVIDGPVSQEIHDVVKKYKKYSNLIVIELKNNHGLPRALNHVIFNHIKTEWIIRSDADDINYPNRFKILSGYFNSSYSLIGSYIKEIYDDFECYKIAPLQKNQIKKYIKFRNPFNHMSVAFTKQSFIRAGGYPELHLKEDYGLWAKYLKNDENICNLSHVLVDVTAGKSFIKRRSGFKYLQSEFHLQRLLINCGINNLFESFFIFFFRLILFSTPVKIKTLIYTKYLRKNILHDYRH